MGWQAWWSVVAVTLVVASTAAAVEVTPATGCQGEEVCKLKTTCLAQHGKHAGEDSQLKLKQCGGDKDHPKVCCQKPAKKPKPVGGAAAVTGVNGEDLLPKNDECGLRPETVYRIMYGQEAPMNAYPWLVLLGYKSATEPLWRCGGALINEQYVITAGHCAQKENDMGLPVIVRLGEHNLATNLDCSQTSPQRTCSPPQDIAPESCLVHENFNKRVVLSDDIALIRLVKKATLGASVQPVCLPPKNLDIERFLGSREAIVAGWGKTQRSSQSKVLQMARVPFASKAKCKIIYPFDILDEQVCFGGKGKVDSCYGDSGGPVFQTDLETHHYVMLGIVSFGMPICGLPEVPAVYTKVPSYRDWIVKNIKP